MMCVGPALCFAVAGEGEAEDGALVNASAVCDGGHDGVIAGNWYERCS